MFSYIQSVLAIAALVFFPFIHRFVGSVFSFFLLLFLSTFFFVNFKNKNNKLFGTLKTNKPQQQQRKC
jgi:cell shape-determining protein MreC